MGNNQGSEKKEEIPVRIDNPFSAIQLLTGHSDIIRSLIVLDDKRLKIFFLSQTLPYLFLIFSDSRQEQTMAM